MKKSHFFSLSGGIVFAFFGCQKMEKTTLDFVSRKTSTPDEITRIVMLDSMNGYLAGGKIWESGFIFSTKTGGLNWNFDSTEGPAQKFFGLTKDQNGNVFAVGSAGQFWKKLRGESTWKLVRQDWWWSRGAAFWSENQGIVVAGEGFRVGVTQPFGANFEPLDTTTFNQELDDVAFADSSTAVAVGFGVIIRTRDSGKTWQRAEPTGEHFQKVVFPTSKTGFVIGLFGTILKTENGGETWREIRKGGSANGATRLRGLHFLDEKTGAVVGDEGLFWLTRDGGETFLEVENARTDVDFRDVFLFKNRGLAVGTAGAVEEFSF